MTHLELLHLKVRELGGRQVRSLMPTMHSNKFNAIVAAIDPDLPPNVIAKLEELWPEHLTESPTEEIPPLLGANQLNYCILTPVRNTYDPSTVGSIVGLVRRTGCGWMQLPFDSMIARSRNVLTAQFLRSDYEWSLWVDDDMVIPNGEPIWFRKALFKKEQELSNEFAGLVAPYQLASWGKKLVSAVYYSRHGSPTMTAGFNPGTTLTNQPPFRQILPVRYSGMGCCMIHRSVYEDILKLHPDLWDGSVKECQVFSTFQTDGRMAGEDEAFCLRAKEAGHDTFLDLSVVCGHVGRRVNYVPARIA